VPRRAPRVRPGAGNAPVSARAPAPASSPHPHTARRLRTSGTPSRPRTPGRSPGRATGAGLDAGPARGHAAGASQPRHPGHRRRIRRGLHRQGARARSPRRRPAGSARAGGERPAGTDPVTAHVCGHRRSAGCPGPLRGQERHAADRRKGRGDGVYGDVASPPERRAHSPRVGSSSGASPREQSAVRVPAVSGAECAPGLVCRSVSHGGVPRRAVAAGSDCTAAEADAVSGCLPGGWRRGPSR
jgi:hypothetical protein